MFTVKDNGVERGKYPTIEEAKQAIYRDEAVRTGDKVADIEARATWAGEYKAGSSTEVDPKISLYGYWRIEQD